MNQDAIPGLRFAISLFSPAIEKHRIILADEIENESPTYAIEHVRGVLRTYAMVVGGLKIELERATDGDWARRFVAHDDFVKAVVVEEEVHTQLAEASQADDEDEVDRIEELWHEASRLADAAAIKYATQ